MTTLQAGVEPLIYTLVALGGGVAVKAFEWIANRTRAEAELEQIQAKTAQGWLAEQRAWYEKRLDDLQATIGEMAKRITDLRAEVAQLRADLAVSRDETAAARERIE